MAAQALYDLEDMGSQKNCDPAFGHASEQRFQRTRCERIDAFEWLVEKKDARSVDHSSGERQFFLHAVRIVGDDGFGAVGELHEFEQLFGAPARGGAVESIHAANKIEILGTGQAFEKPHAFGDDTDLTLYFDGVRGKIQAQKLNAARTWRQQTGQHLDSCGFSGTIGTEKTEKLSRCD